MRKIHKMFSEVLNWLKNINAHFKLGKRLYTLCAAGLLKIFHTVGQKNQKYTRTAN